jgi:hypothetical protein
MIVGSFTLPSQHRFEFKLLQQTRELSCHRLLILSDSVPDVPMRTQRVLRKITWLANCAALAFAGFCIQAADSGITTFQEGKATTSENSNALIGHWRKTTISYTGSVDEHLVLHVDTTAENWTATAYERREPVTGHWNVEGKTLILSFGGNDRSGPFTFYQGQLVFPNIPNHRGFWEKIE